MTSPIHIDFQPIGRRIEIASGLNLLEAAQQAGIDLVAACGGTGICGTCRVRPHGRVSALTPSEEEQLEPAQLAAGDRLACQCIPLGSLMVEIPPESLPVPQKIQTEGQMGSVALQPAVHAIELALEPPTLHDLRADSTRLSAALAAAGGPANLQAGLAALEQLSGQLRSTGWQVRLALYDSPPALAAALPPGAALLGLAVDLGSTKLALYLVNLESGAVLGQAGVMNPQIAYGEDVVNRIAFANKSAENRRLLQRRVVDEINQAAGELCARAGMQAGQVVEAVVVGNTAMHHAFTHLPVAQLGAAPYVPAVSEPLWVEASRLGLHFAPGGRVYLPENIAGYVGGDHTAALLASLPDEDPLPEVAVLVDIGTNTEISLVSAAGIFTCSTASGPAFEGAHIHDGMRAAPGAIERVRIRDGRPQVWTIGGQAAVGICGSGILQAVAELLKAGIVDLRGALNKDAPGVRQADGRREFLLVPAAQSGHGRDIVVTRRDIHEIQLAKGAIRAGIEIMLAKAGLQAGDVQRWIIAGAFGTYLDVSSAIRVGMFPAQPLERFHQVGNAAGVGARHLLLSTAERARAARLVQKVNYVELTVEPSFTEQFMAAMYL